MNQATIDFIRNHADDDVRQLALRGTKNLEVDLPFALDQIAGRQTARRKLPSWAATEGIVYPPHLSMEQCSSEQTARYKADIAGSGHRLVDLTGGFGVDFSVMARGFAEAVYVERRAPLCEIAAENFRLLGLHQAVVVCGDGTDYLQTMPPADLIYIDPARRDDHGGRTYGIADCTPNVLSIRDLLLEKAERVLIKLSPMLDWRKAVSDLGSQYVREVHIVSVANECKELLILLSPGTSFRLVCSNDNTKFEAHWSHESHESHWPHWPHNPHYLYSPNASIMKAGCFSVLEQRFPVSQVAPNSHLFLSSDEIDDFPGRRFQIQSISSLNKKELSSVLAPLERANMTVRNFPMTVDQLRKKLKLKDGGDTYIFATTTADGQHRLFICRKIG